VPPPRIRAAVESDLDDMTRMIEQLFALESDFPFEAAKVRRGLELLHARADSAALWVAELDGQVVGMCSAQIVISTAEGGPAAWVEDVVVRNEMRGLGIGRMLLATLSAWAVRRGIGRLQLLADAENAAALGFYRRMDWQTTQLICLRLRPGD
jgi:GNAT superfamily N-acetyltransferase